MITRFDGGLGFVAIGWHVSNGVRVLVMSEMLCIGHRLERAIARHRSPAELEREQGKQKDGEDATHGKESSGYKVGAWMGPVSGSWGFTTSRRGHARHCGSSRAG